MLQLFSFSKEIFLLHAFLNIKSSYFLKAKIFSIILKYFSVAKSILLSLMST